MTPWLSIVGLGEEGLPGLTPAAQSLLDDAQVLIGGERHLAMVPDDGRERLTWPSPLSALVADIESRRGQRVCILATGDPMHYGIGVTLARRIPREEMIIIPGVSAFSLAAARMGWSLADVDCLTLHGRPLSIMASYLQPGRRLLLLSDGAHSPAEVSALLKTQGYGASPMTVLEHMGGERERRMEGAAADWDEQEGAAFNTIAVACEAAPGRVVLQRSPGLPDDAFRHDGLITKREVRAITMSSLAPVPGQLLWDVGAGSGSIAIEWMRAAPNGRAIAIERVAARRGFITENATALGTPLLKIVDGTAPEAFEGLEAPDAIFIGGGLAEEELLPAAWQALKPGGRLVCNSVTLEGDRAVLDWQARHGGELVRLAISRAAPLGSFNSWRPLAPITQYAGCKQ
ncbi:MAG: precorrin-6y C5,15-methyltransferase (decarboxylating) subunit CbiE [Pseudomonadota bacterium]